MLGVVAGLAMLLGRRRLFPNRISRQLAAAFASLFLACALADGLCIALDLPVEVAVVLNMLAVFLIVVGIVITVDVRLWTVASVYFVATVGCAWQPAYAFEIAGTGDITAAMVLVIVWRRPGQPVSTWSEHDEMP